MNQSNISYTETSMNRSQDGPGQNGTGMFPPGVEQGAKSTTGKLNLFNSHSLNFYSCLMCFEGLYLGSCE